VIGMWQLYYLHVCMYKTSGFGSIEGYIKRIQGSQHVIKGSVPSKSVLWEMKPLGRPSAFSWNNMSRHEMRYEQCHVS
jgi:hypothetical protein